MSKEELEMLQNDIINKNLSYVDIYNYLTEQRKKGYFLDIPNNKVLSYLETKMEIKGYTGTRVSYDAPNDNSSSGGGGGGGSNKNKNPGASSDTGDSDKNTKSTVPADGLDTGNQKTDDGTQLPETTEADATDVKDKQEISVKGETRRIDTNELVASSDSSGDYTQTDNTIGAHSSFTYSDESSQGDKMYEQIQNNQGVRNTLASLTDKGVNIDFGTYGIKNTNNPGFTSVTADEIRHAMDVVQADLIDIDSAIKTYEAENIDLVKENKAWEAVVRSGPEAVYKEEPDGEGGIKQIFDHWDWSRVKEAEAKIAENIAKLNQNNSRIAELGKQYRERMEVNSKLNENYMALLELEKDLSNPNRFKLERTDNLIDPRDILGTTNEYGQIYGQLYETEYNNTGLRYVIYPAGYPPQLVLAGDGKAYQNPLDIANGGTYTYGQPMTITNAGRYNMGPVWQNGEEVKDHGYNPQKVGGATLYLVKNEDDGSYKLGSVTNLENGEYVGNEKLQEIQPEWAVMGFTPIIENGKGITYDNMVSGHGDELNKTENPRTFIGQLKNGDFIIGTCDGRDNNATNGLTLGSLIHGIKENVPQVDYAYNLDGGYSTYMYHNGQEADNVTKFGSNGKPLTGTDTNGYTYKNGVRDVNNVFVF